MLRPALLPAELAAEKIPFLTEVDLLREDSQRNILDRLLTASAGPAFAASTGEPSRLAAPDLTALAQLQKAIEKIKALTANADSKGQEAARLQENEVRLTEEISGLKESEVRLTEEIRLLRENEVRLASSSGEVAAALQVRVTELEQSEGRLTQELAEVRATVSESQDRIASQQGNLTACFIVMA